MQTPTKYNGRKSLFEEPSAVPLVMIDEDWHCTVIFLPHCQYQLLVLVVSDGEREASGEVATFALSSHLVDLHFYLYQFSSLPFKGPSINDIRIKG